MEAKEVRKRREALGLSQEKLGKKLGGYDRITVLRWESGYQKPPAMLDLALKQLENGG